MLDFVIMIGLLFFIQLHNLILSSDPVQIHAIFGFYQEKTRELLVRNRKHELTLK